MSASSSWPPSLFFDHRYEAGQSYPLGATPYPSGVNFSVYSKHCDGLELLLFNSPEDPQPARVIELDPSRNHRTFHYWHAFVPNTGPGQIYRSAGVMNGRQFLNFMADETGGLSTWYAHNLEEGLADVDEFSRSYYVLGYQRQPDDPEVVSVEVNCTFPQAEITAAPTQLANVPTIDRVFGERPDPQVHLIHVGIHGRQARLHVRVATHLGKAPFPLQS